MGYFMRRAPEDVHRAWFESVEQLIDPYEARYLRSRVEVRMGQLLRAAELNDAAVRPGLRGPKAVSRRLGAAEGWLMVGRIERAGAQLDAADEELRHIRSAHLALHARSHRRKVAYRSCQTIAPSAEWFDALQRLSQNTTAYMLLVEGAIAWREPSTQMRRSTCGPSSAQPTRWLAGGSLRM